MEIHCVIEKNPSFVENILNICTKNELEVGLLPTLRKTSATARHSFLSPTRLIGCSYHPRIQASTGSPLIKSGPEPSNFEDLCLANVSVKYFSKLCIGTSKI